MRFDVMQGKLGNCWLMAVVAILTLSDELFYRVVPRDQSFTQNYESIFHFQFWQYGRWLDIIVDDRLPCSQNGELLYMHSQNLNEFWSALLEKAYAKLYGSYEALWSGNTGEALEDMTGGFTEFIELKYSPINLVQMMAKGFAMGSLFGCSIKTDSHVSETKLPNGLDHAYSITGIRSVPTQSGQQVLLRIRNPWGNDQEWRGPWSDRSPEWGQLSDGLKRDMALLSEHDGEFWMSFEDFVRNFEKLEICHLGPDAFEEIYQMTSRKSAVHQNWSIRIHHGGWRKHQSAGGCRNYLQTFALNPQIRIKIAGQNANAFDFDEDGRLCTVVIALMQKFIREKKYLGVENLSIGFAVYQANSLRGRLGKEFFDQNKFYVHSQFMCLREVSASFRMPPGEYVIVPSTFKPDEEGEFMLRIFANGFLESWDL